MRPLLTLTNRQANLTLLYDPIHITFMLKKHLNLIRPYLICIGNEAEGFIVLMFQWLSGLLRLILQGL